MSDTALGPQWWRAADGKWHPPELRPPSARTAVAAADQQATSEDGDADDRTAPSGALPDSLEPSGGPEAADSSEVTVGDLGSVADIDPVSSLTTSDGPFADAGTASETDLEDPAEGADPAPLDPLPPLRIASSMPIRPVEPTYSWGPTVPDSELPPEIQRTIPPFKPRTAGAGTAVGVVHVTNVAAADPLPEAVVASESGEAYPDEVPEEEGDLSSSLQALVFGDTGQVEVEVASEVEVIPGPEAVPPAAPPPAPLRLVADPGTARIEPELTAPVPAPASHSRVVEPIPAESVSAASMPVAPAPAPAAAPAPAPAPAPAAAPAPVPSPVPAPAAAVAPTPTPAVVEPEALDPVPDTAVAHAPAPAADRPGGDHSDPAESHPAAAKPVEEVLAGPTVSGSAPRTTNIPASIAAKNAEHFKGSREFPDLLGMALKGSSLADQVEVKYDAASMRKPATGNAAAKEPPTGGSDKNGKRWKRKGR